MTILSYIQSALPPGVLATGGFAAIGAILVAARNNISSFVSYVSNVVFVQSQIHGFSATTAVRMHLRGSYYRFPLGAKIYLSLYAQVREAALWRHIPFEMPPTTSFYFGKRGFFVASVNNNILNLTSIRGWASVRDLINDSLNDYEANQEDAYAGYYRLNKVIGSAGDKSFDFSRSSVKDSQTPEPNSSSIAAQVDSGGLPDYRVDTSFRYSTEDLNWSRKEDPYRGLFFEPETESLIEDAKRWYSMRKWYEDRNIPWRRGYLLHGPGGTGKSSLTKAIAQALRVNLYQFFLSTLTDKEFVKEWEQLSTPCIVLLEDIDGVFQGRKNITVHQSLSFDCLLNQISGVGAMNGILLMVTTNKLDCIDPALGTAVDASGTGRSTRPGRLDVILHMGVTSASTRHRIAEFVLKDAPIAFKNLLVNKGEGMTPAQFQSWCVDIAFQTVNGINYQEQLSRFMYEETMNVELVAVNSSAIEDESENMVNHSV